MSSKSYDDVAWAISTQIWEDWLDLLRTDADIYNDIGIILSEEFKDLEWESFEYLMTGGFNTCFKMNFANSFGAIIRFPLPGAVMFPAEKVCNEVSAMRFILDKSSDKMPIPVPFVFRAAETKESPSDMGPFIIMSYVPHSKSMADLLEAPEREAGQPPVLNPGLEQVRLERLFRKLAKIVLSLSTLSFDRIGSLHRNDNSTWEVLSRPLSYSMSEIVQLGTLPRSKLPTTMFKKAWSYFEALAELHISHLMTKRNEDSIEADIDNDLLADIFRRKFVARFLFRKLVRDVEQRKQWLMYENGPFPVWCDDFRPENVLADQAENIVGVVDWEFTYTAPVELHMRRLGGFFLRSQKIGRATFLEAMRKCEDEAIQKGHLVESHRLSSRMRDSWQTGDFWLMYAARNNFAFDAVYWEKIDQRFFGTVPHANDNVWDVWQKRLYLLETGEKGLMEEYVDLKLKQRKELLLAWDLDEYSAIWIQRMKEARWKQMDREREDNERLGREDGDVC